MSEENYPEPTSPEPCEEELWRMLIDGVCEATDGCTIEPDGVCEHGHPSWFLKLGIC